MPIEFAVVISDMFRSVKRQEKSKTDKEASGCIVSWGRKSEKAWMDGTYESQEKRHD